MTETAGDVLAVPVPLCGARGLAGAGAVEWVCDQPAGHDGAHHMVNRYPNRPIVHRG